jgi:hypothetical protein
VLFRKKHLDGLADGSITVAFRRWRRPTVRAGGTLQTRVGVLAIDGLARVVLVEIGDDDARRAGYPSRGALVAEMTARSEGDVYRIDFHMAGPDPRIALRERAELEPDELAEVRRRLDRLDAASPHGPWTRATLALIAARPGTRAPDLATEMGREKLPFKADVRKLKALGLTESLAVGYRISPRGTTVLRALDADGG